MNTRTWATTLRSEPRGWARLISAGLRLLVGGVLGRQAALGVAMLEGYSDGLGAVILTALAGTVFLTLGVRTLFRAIAEIRD